MARFMRFSRINLLLLLLCWIISFGLLAKPALARPSSSSSSSGAQLAYIVSSCQTTRYQDLCIRYLSKFANYNIYTQEQLVHVALSVSLSRASYTRSYLLQVAADLKAAKADEYQAVKDCTDQINSGVEQLSQSIRELRRLENKANTVGREQDVFWHIDNVETWVSAALTDASTCVDAFPQRNMSKLNAIIKGKVLNVAQTTSNALALFHSYATRYKAAAAAAKKP